MFWCFVFFVNSIDRNPTHQPAPRKKSIFHQMFQPTELSVRFRKNLLTIWRAVGSPMSRHWHQIQRGNSRKSVEFRSFFPRFRGWSTTAFPTLTGPFTPRLALAFLGFFWGVCKAGLGQQHSNVHQIGGKSSVQVVRNLYFSWELFLSTILSWFVPSSETVLLRHVLILMVLKRPLHR